MFKEEFGKINIQFFGDETNVDGSTEGGVESPKTKTYSEEEYLKLKTSYDKTASELANAKKQIKDKMSEDEQKAAAEEEKDQKFKDLQSKIEDYELKDELVRGNLFTSEEIDKIVSKKGNKKELINAIVGITNAKIEEAKKNAIADFMRSSDGKGTSGNKNSSTIDKDLENYLNANKKDSSNKARDYYLKK